MGKTKVFLDTNVLISALGWKGKPRVIFEKCIHNELELITSIQQLEELRRVVDYPKFAFSDEQKSSFLSIFLEVALMIKIPGKLLVITEDTDDNAMLETAVVGQADYLISGDPHLLQFKTFENIKIVTPHEFLNINTHPYP